MPIDCGFDEIGSKESQRYCHVDFAHAALGAGGDALGRGRRILDQLREPTAPLRNRSNQCCFRLRPDGPRTLLRWVSRQKNFATPCARDQMETVTEQAKHLSTIAKEITHAATEPLKMSVAKAFNSAA